MILWHDLGLEAVGDEKTRESEARVVQRLISISCNREGVVPNKSICDHDRECSDIT
jgi:hypothetical protein